MPAEVLPILKPRCKRAPDGTLEIPILGDIGVDGVCSGPATAMEWILSELAYFKPDRVKFIIFSPGGYVYDAIAVVGYLTAHGIESWSEIYGYAYSAATVFVAHSGPARTAMAAGTMIGIHEAAGGDDQMRAEANAFLVDLYSKAYGWSKAQTLKYMRDDAPRGTMWSAKDAKKEGICTEIMDGAKVAATLNLNPPAMADKKTIKAEVKVKLGTMEAIRAAMGEGTTVEVEVEVEKPAADRIAELEAENAAQKAELDELKGKPVEVPVEITEQVTNAKAEATRAKADLDAATAAHKKEVDDLKAAHAKEMQKPMAERTVADNREAGVASMPGVEQESPNVAALKGAMKGAVPATKNKAAK